MRECLVFANGGYGNEAVVESKTKNKLYHVRELSFDWKHCISNKSCITFKKIHVIGNGIYVAILLIINIVLQRIYSSNEQGISHTDYAYVVGEVWSSGFIVRDVPISFCSNFQLQLLGDVAEKNKLLLTSCYSILPFS